MRRSFLLLAVLMTACATAQPVVEIQSEGVGDPSVSNDERLNAVLWLQTAAEYRAATIQAFQVAQRMLGRSLADLAWTAAEEQSGNPTSLPPAVIVDIDETVLDNSPFEARQIRGGQEFSEDIWNTWVQEAKAQPVSGAVTFAKEAAARGVTVFYVSNRLATQESATRANLAATGFPVDTAVDAVLLRNEKPDWQSDKSTRRRDIASRYRIIMIIGDDFNDFTSAARGSWEQRLEAVDRAAPLWGSKWIIIPNPMYGSWERAIVGTEPNLTEAEKLRRKINALRP